MDQTLTPQVKWCQRKDRVLAKLEARNPKSETIEFVAPNLLKYNGVCDGKDYKLELELFDDIDVENSGYKRCGFVVDLLIKKAEEKSWPRFTKTTQKLANVAVDWNNWVDSDEEDPEEEADGGQDFNFGPQEGDSDEEEGQEGLDDLEGQEDVAQTQQSEGQIQTEGLNWEEVPMDAPDMK